MAQLATREEGAVVRPLNVLVPLIRKDFADAEEAGKPFNTAAGEKLNEAREGHFDGNAAGFYSWGEKSFGKSKTQLRTCMAYGAAGGTKSFKSKHDFTFTKKREGGLGWTPRKARSYTEAVDPIATRAFDEARRLRAEESLTRQQEREAERKLALRLIDIGYKVLAQTLHPDKGGSRDAMARLNRVRDRLKECI